MGLSLVKECDLSSKECYLFDMLVVGKIRFRYVISVVFLK